jgi:uncharacterized protein YgiB involved in biofilm formation
MKRSQAVSLILLAGVGVAAVKLAEGDPTQLEEDALIFPSAENCIDSRIRTPVDCRAAGEEAQKEAARVAPRYADQADCERHHGPGCRAVENAAGPMFVPALAGFMMGRFPHQSMPTQPLYNHVTQERRKEEESGSFGGGGGGYCTSGGNHVARAWSGSPSARVSSEAAWERLSSPRTIARGAPAFKAHGIASRGGFGSTGRGLSSGG